MHTQPGFRFQPRIPVRLVGSIMLLALVLVSALPWRSPVRAQAPVARGAVHGWVRQAADGRGVAGARVQIGSVVVHTDHNGTIQSTDVVLNQLIQAVDVEVTAPGFGTWRYLGIELAATHPVELQVLLTDEPQLTQPQPALEAAAAPFDGPPDYINVGRTFSTSCVYPPTNIQRVDRMPFIDYVQNVLPHEWVASWPAASLDAGAVAATQFAWSSAFVQRKWTRYGYPFDVVDSVCDQVYKDRAPSASYGATDAAVARMWGTALVRDNKLITTYFRDHDDSCVRANSADCMGQWGSYQRAQAGMSGLQILHYYYDPVTHVRTAPALRGLVLQRSPDIQLWPGHSQTITVCMRNVGSATWQQGLTSLDIVDPNNPQNTGYVSPFAHSSWPSAQRPATLQQPRAATSQSGSWRFTVSAPPKLAPGTYRLLVQPIHGDGAPIATDSPLAWTITVRSAAPARAYATFLPTLAQPTPAAKCA